MTQHKQKARFRVGGGGVCEASLYRFTGPDGKNIEVEPVWIAAGSIEEALGYMKEYYGEFRIRRVEFIAMARLLSGSPVD